MNSDFYEKFNASVKCKLKEYFKSLNDCISLTQKETKLINEDFEKAILYYHKKGIKIDKILNLLSVDKLGSCYKDNSNNWYPLDNAAKVYPLSMKENWMSVFRISYYLKEDIVAEIFQIALLFTMKRFPTFRTTVRKGFFWHYLDEIKKRFHVYKDNKLPCSYINVSTLRKQSFKAVYYKNRISVEYFHLLTDGYGACIFISTLVNTYIELLGNKVSYNDFVLNIEQTPLKEEIEEAFTKSQKTKNTRSFIENKAVQVDGKISNINPSQILHFDMDVDKVKKLAKEKNVTITELILAFIYIALSYSTSKEGNIKVQVPINMRGYYPSKTLRNFSLYVIISINKNDINDFDKLLLNIKKQMSEKNTKENMSETITYTNKLINSIKYIPILIKKPFVSIAYSFLGDKAITTVLSNLGVISIPEEMKLNVEKMDMVLGTNRINKVLFSMITCNNILTLSISKATTNKSVENHLFNLLNQYGLNPKVHGSEIYENRK